MHRLHVPMQLRKTLASTNVIESAFSIVEQVCKNVKRWHGGDQRERWVGSGLLVAQKQFRKVTGHKQIPALIRELEALVPSKSVVKRERRRRVGYTGAASFNGKPGIPEANPGLQCEALSAEQLMFNTPETQRGKTSAHSQRNSGACITPSGRESRRFGSQLPGIS